MSSVSTYTFDNMSRIGLDDCCQSQTSLQNVSYCNYMTQNYFKNKCSPFEMATSQPGIFYSGGHGSACGSNIDDGSKLQIGSIQTNPKCRIDLFQRPFATVPFLGKGSGNPVVESQMQQGTQDINKRSVNNLGEKSYIKYHQTPLLQSVKNKLDNSTNSIESDAANGWIRGGIPSRELTRDNN